MSEQMKSLLFALLATLFIGISVSLFVSGREREFLMRKGHECSLQNKLYDSPSGICLNEDELKRIKLQRTIPQTGNGSGLIGFLVGRAIGGYK